MKDNQTKIAQNIQTTINDSLVELAPVQTI